MAIETVKSWLHKAEDKLDEHGKPAWITAMVVGFIFLWPVGLALLLYMLWSGRMGCNSKKRWGRKAAVTETTGNSAFDEYRADTLRRLEEEQLAFDGFMERLRKARDKSEFDQFMAERRGKGDHSETGIA